MQIKMTMTGDWARASRVARMLRDGFGKAAEVAIMREAITLRDHIVKNITSGGAHAGKPFAPLSPMTVIIRRFRGFRGSKPLMVSGGLRGAVSVVRTSGGGAFVGIRRGAPHKGFGGSAANLAAIHEFGKTIVVNKTLKMIRFLAAALRSAGKSFGDGGGSVGTPSVIVIRIPARPFVGPTLEKYATPEAVRARFWKTVSEQLPGIF